MAHSRILIADDDPQAQRLIAAVLAGEGYELCFAGTGPEAIEQARRTKPDLVLLDVLMPGLDGIEVCRRLRGDAELSELPVVLVTALDDRQARLRGLEAGADDFIAKPFDLAELKVRVRTITRLNRFRHLHVERARFAWIVEHSEDGVLILGERDAIRYANPPARRYLDVALSEDFDAGLVELARRSYRLQPEELAEAWLAPGPEGAPTERYLVRPESALAQELWLRVDVLDAEPGGDDSRLVRLRDVTREVAARRESWAFQSALSHKLLTPLNWLLPALDELSADVSGMSRDEIATWLEHARRGALGVKRHVDDLLQYLRVARQSPCGEGPGCRLSELHAIVTRVAAGLALAPVPVRLSAQLADAVLPLDADRLEMILWELLENSRKFHPSSSPNVSVEVEPAGEIDVTLRVVDDGVTLPSDQLAQAWLPYYQLEGRFTGEVEGIGLGLPLVASLVWGSGGRCQLRNRRPGPGMVVELRLPVLQTTGAEAK